ncbi:nucleotide disphospho-sugar-binding domain-containing protein [Streptomyces sp. NPDC048606]|uniref:nucleotide disphospho-sugar-binding domain-containing protein n=1 Tax=Streptomyces sp. NPDC048606 TaxID=3154726 RepID=UPI00342496CC
MRVLLTTWAWPSHLYPMVPLGWALQAAGHEVRVAVGPSLADAVTATGLTPVVVRDDVDLVGLSTAPALKSWHRQERWPADWYGRPERLSVDQRRMYAALGHKQTAMAASMVDGVVDFARDWRPDLVVHDAVTFAGLVAGAVLGVPTVATLWGAIALPRHQRDLLTGELAPDFTDLFARFGVPPKPGPDLWLDPCPPRMGLPSPEPRVSHRYIPYNGPGGAPDWLREPTDLPRVCVTWGITSGRIGKAGTPDVLDRVLEAVDGLDVEVVLAVSTEGRAALGALPERIRVAESLPLHLLLPSCAAVVHQGGGGTTMTALHAGTPQLIVSPRPEQMMTGDRLEGLGAARHLVRGELAADPEGATGRLRAALRDLLDDESHARAAALLRADVLDLPDPVALLPHLEALAASGTPRPPQGPRPLAKVAS